MRATICQLCVCVLAAFAVTLRNRLFVPVDAMFKTIKVVSPIEQIEIDVSSIFRDVVSSVIHVSGKAAIEVSLTGKRCNLPVLRGRLIGERAVILHWSVLDSGTLLGTYDQIPSGLYFVEIIALYCSRFNRKIPVHVIRNMCLEDSKRHRITAVNSSINVADKPWSGSVNKIGSWRRKREFVQTLPVYTRAQPNGCNLPACNASSLSKLSKVERMYEFMYSNETMNSLEADLSANSLRSYVFCFIGASHSRTIVEMLSDHFGKGPWFQHIDAAFAENLTKAAKSVRSHKCTHAVVGIGQWPAGWPGGAPMSFQEYEQSMHDGLAKFTTILDSRTKVHVRNVHENPLGKKISSCPPTDWRNPEVVRVYNELLLEVCTRLKLPFIDTTDITQPMWDTAPDWCHYKNEVGRIESIYILQFILKSR